jgi:putative transposase
VLYYTSMSRYISSINNFNDLVELWEKIKDNAPFDVIFFEIRCKYCDSEDISKFGRYKNIQRWWCKRCKRKFTDNRAPPGMKTPQNMINSAVSMYYNGVPITTIRRQLLADYNIYPSDSIIHKWVYRDTENTLEHTRNHKPSTGNRWIVFESSIMIGPNKLWLFDIVDLKTRFLLASKFSQNRDAEDMTLLIETAREKVQKIPGDINIIAKRKYFGVIESVLGPNVQLSNSKYQQEEAHIAEYWNFVIRVRRKILRGQKLLNLAQLILNGWIFYQNYVVTQKFLKEKTAAQEAGIEYQYKDGTQIEEYRL